MRWFRRRRPVELNKQIFATTYRNGTAEYMVYEADGIKVFKTYKEAEEWISGTTPSNK